MTHDRVDRVVRNLLVAGTVMLAVILALNFWIATSGRSQTLMEMDRRLARIESHTSFIACIALLPPVQRSAEEIAGCVGDNGQ